MFIASLLLPLSGSLQHIKKIAQPPNTLTHGARLLKTSLIHGNHLTRNRVQSNHLCILTTDACASDSMKTTRASTVQVSVTQLSKPAAGIVTRCTCQHEMHEQMKSRSPGNQRMIGGDLCRVFTFRDSEIDMTAARAAPRH